MCFYYLATSVQIMFVEKDLFKLKYIQTVIKPVEDSVDSKTVEFVVDVDSQNCSSFCFITTNLTVVLERPC